MEVRIKKLHPDAKIPEYSYEDDAGCDMFAVEDVVIKSGQRAQIRTGIAMEIPEGHVGLIWDKSGLSHRAGLTNIGGVFDSGFRGEWILGLVNTSDQDYHLKKGDKIAQIIIQQKVTANFVEVDELSERERGDRAFGSSGK